MIFTMKTQPNLLIFHAYDDMIKAIGPYDHLKKKPILCLSFESLSMVGMGVTWGYLELLKERHPTWVPFFGVDCGECSGYVLSALRHGIKHMLYYGPKDTLHKLQQAAKPYGAKVIGR